MLKLFTNIKQVAEHPQSLVVILIDEVESLVFARDAVSSSEPSDSLRVVNAVLTQLDQLRKYSNVLVLTTSNLTSTIDLAFVDRADLKQFIGQPNIEAVYEILRSAIDELSKVRFLHSTIFIHLKHTKRDIISYRWISFRQHNVSVPIAMFLKTMIMIWASLVSRAVHTCFKSAKNVLV